MYKHVRGPVQVRHFLLNRTPMYARERSTIRRLFKRGKEIQVKSGTI